MNIVQLIEKKRDGGELSAAEIEFFIQGYTATKEVTDYQASAMLMAIYFRGMTDPELANFTTEMVKTGDTLDFSHQSGIFVDKHSTGGVGDKTSIVLGPILAAAGLKLAKMSGRGLGFTGGTLDKLEAIPGFRVELSESEFFAQVEKISIALIGQSNNMVLADKKFYALRDVTGTVSSIPLMASSIMSKKIAAGAQIILLDVKYGDGAFMKDVDSATELAKRMIKIGEAAGRKVFAEITSMQSVLGTMVGNALEVKEAIDFLKGDYDRDFHELCQHSFSVFAKEANFAGDNAESNALFEELISSGKALQKLREMIEAQGGDSAVIDDEAKLNISTEIIKIKAESAGYISYVKTMDIGVLSAEMGAGRLTLEDKIDPSVGIEICKKLGDKVEIGDTICKLYHHATSEKQAIFAAKAKSCFEISDKLPKIDPLIAKTL